MVGASRRRPRDLQKLSWTVDRVVRTHVHAHIDKAHWHTGGTEMSPRTPMDHFVTVSIRLEDPWAVPMILCVYQGTRSWTVGNIENPGSQANRSNMSCKTWQVPRTCHCHHWTSSVSPLCLQLNLRQNYPTEKDIHWFALSSLSVTSTTKWRAPLSITNTVDRYGCRSWEVDGSIQKTKHPNQSSLIPRCSITWIWAGINHVELHNLDCSGISWESQSITVIQTREQPKKPLKGWQLLMEDTVYVLIDLHTNTSTTDYLPLP